jgi:hypothetical protein
MSELMNPGLHPDPDSLNAFLEGALPEHERLRCVAHLADCPQCREVVFLAQEPPPAPVAARPTPGWRRWFTPVPMLAAAAMVCLAVSGVWLYVRNPAEAPAVDRITRISPAPPPSGTPAIPDANAMKEARLPKPAQTSRGPEMAAAAPAPKTGAPTPGVTAATSAQGTIPSGPPASPAISAANLPAVPPEPEKSVNAATRAEPPATGPSAISGTVTDATSAVISGASIKVRQLGGTLTANARTDVSGQFKVELPAGRYELQIDAPGFRQTLRQVDLQPREVASVQSQLEVGSVAETVEVTAEAASLQTSSASMSRTSSRKKAVEVLPRPLPSKLIPAMSVTSGKIVLSVDSAGTVYVSANSGKTWKLVKPVWSGKVDSIALADPSPTTNAKFQLITDSDAVWMSRDGARWSPAPR